jgi:hypothetical protein
MISNLKSHPSNKGDGNGLTLCPLAEVLKFIRDRTRDLLIIQEHPNGMWWLGTGWGSGGMRLSGSPKPLVVTARV